MPTLTNRLRQAAQYVWQGELYDLLIEAAVAMESAEQPQERKPLTDDEALKLIEIVGGTDETMDYDHLALARAIEAAHGISGE